jgi:Site-specific recombinases, DNA invertase Pin homologs
MGFYVRLSKEDGHDESYSVKNQRDLLQEYVDRSDEEFTIVDTYTDDGHTGTDSDRKNFMRLLQDVKDRKVNCVIVKDLSRLSRNYCEAGFYLEQLFTSLDVRFISLEYPALDSYKHPEQMNSVLVPMQNVINDDFCRQTSLKIRSVFNMKRRRGEFIGAFAPYGYLKDPTDRHSFIVDEEAAQTVGYIFTWFNAGMSKNGIVQRLNSLGILCPAAYKRSKGINYQNPHDKFGNTLWCAASVTKILKDRTYLGDMVQGRYRIKSYKVHTQILTPEVEWFIVEGTHEPIIDKDIFEKAQSLQKRDTRTAPQKKDVYLFSGFIRCADCGKSMSRSKMKDHVYYYCRTYKDASKTACTKHTIRHDKLEQAVLASIRIQVALAITMDEMLSEINAAPHAGKQPKLDDTLKNREKELGKIARYKRSLYQSLQDGDISREDYALMRRRYGEEIDQLKQVIERLKEERRIIAQGVDTENPFLTRFKKNGNIDALTRDILAELVETVLVHEGGNIIIRFNFADEYCRAAGSIENNKRLPA